jgi:hypothetical protein
MKTPYDPGPTNGFRKSHNYARIVDEGVPPDIGPWPSSSSCREQYLSDVEGIRIFDYGIRVVSTAFIWKSMGHPSNKKPNWSNGILVNSVDERTWCSSQLE